MESDFCRGGGAIWWVLLLLFICGGCGGDPPLAAIAADESAAAICLETGAVFAAQAGEASRINPETGRSTLAPALYCERCRKWYPSPPLDVLQRTAGAGRCPKTGERLALTGPLPAATVD